MTTLTPSRPHPDPHARWLWALTALLVLVLMAVTGYKYQQHRRHRIIASAAADGQCVLESGPCTATLGDGRRAVFSMAPRPIVATVPVRLELHVEGIEALAVEVQFRDATTHQGPDPLPLKSPTGLHFEGNASLPLCCTRDSTPWIADVIVATSEGRLSFPFRFHLRGAPDA